MGKCKYCRKKAGFFSWKHTECETIFLNSESVLESRLRNAIIGFTPDNVEINHEDSTGINLTFSFNDDEDKIIEGFKEEIDKSKKEATDSFLPISKQNILANTVFYNILEQYLSDKNLSNTELATLNYFREIWVFDKSSNDLIALKMIQARILTRIENGESGDNIITPGGIRHNTPDIPLVLMKSEQLIHATNAKFYEERTKTHYVGGSDGISIKVAKGVYYRKSAFKGERVQEHNMEHIDNGLFALTTKHIYFHGHRKSFRTRLDRVVALDPYEDGIGIRKAGVTSKPQVFKDYDSGMPIDAWFVSNAIRILNDA
jgi:hypothetical protein